MDVNVNSDVKVYGTPTVPVVEQEDRVKPQVTPVPESSDSVKADLNDQRLHGGGRGEEKASLSQKELERVVDEVQKRLDAIGGNLTVGLHEELKSETIVVQIKDKKSDEVVRQFPSEEILKLQEKLRDLIGMLFDESA